MRVERSAVRGYWLGLGLLVAGAVGFRMLVAELNIHLMKESVALRRPLDSVPSKLGRWERVGTDSVLSDPMIEELGTRSYLDRKYAIEGDVSKGFVHVHVAYYTGTIDAIPHIPERCWAVGGMELTRNSEGTPLAVDRSKWRPRKEGASDDGYEVVDVSDPITGDITEITMPVGEIVATTIEFQDPKAPDVRQVGGYFFIANGRATSSSYGVRALAFNLSDRYAYYCKVQLTKAGRVASADGSLIEPFKAEAAELLTDLIPQIMKCLPDWPEWEAKSRGDSAPASIVASQG